MNKQFIRRANKLVVCAMIGNLFIVFDTRTMMAPQAVVVVAPVITETFMSAFPYFSTIFATLRQRFYAPAATISQPGVNCKQPGQYATTAVAGTLAHSVAATDKALCAALGTQVVTGVIEGIVTVEKAGQLAQVGAHAELIDKIAGATIANQELATLAHAHLAASHPGMYTVTPYKPTLLELTSIPGGVQLRIPALGDFRFDVTIPLNCPEPPAVRLQRLAKSTEFWNMLYRLKHDPEYKTKVVGEISDVLDCLLKTRSGNLEESMQACMALQQLRLRGSLNNPLTETVQKLRNFYFTDGKLDVESLLNHAHADHIISNDFIKRIAKGTHHAIRKSDLVDIDFYKQLKHSTNQFGDDLLGCLEACKRYDFKTAETFLVHGGDTDVFQQVIDIYKDQYATVLSKEVKALFGANGIIRVGLTDPAYCANKWTFDHATTEQKKFINQNLLIRHQLKTTLHELWGISDKAPACVHEALYNLLGADGSALIDVSVLQHSIEGIVKAASANERAELIKAFYMPNGVLKEFAQHFKDAKHIKMPKDILTKTYDVERQKLNDLMCELTKSPSKGAAIQAAREHLNDWIGAKNTKDAIESKGRFDRAYTNVFNTYPGGVPPQAVPANMVDVQSSMPMPPGPELEPKNKLKPVVPDLQPKEPKVEVVATWDMPETGKVIHGRYYTKHALERMAPPTKEVIEELEKRAINQGYVRGSDKFRAYVQPRNIPPSVVEDAIKNGTSKVSQNNPNVFEYITDSVKVFVNQNGNVISVYPQ